MIDMPWSESGLTPDIIINPHAFPSRMTIGMLIESMAAKAGALKGIVQDATPFSKPYTDPSSETPMQVFGKQLVEHGFSYYGNEPMYSGVEGCELRADIYFGLVFYQRLRHMVGDKFQVRTTGPVHDLTRQPIKGRKRAGGIRFGEMERDALIAHGGAYLLQDRLVNCSDYGQCWGCKECGSVVSLQMNGRQPKCMVCDAAEKEAEKDSVVVVAVPHVFRYLVTELVSMGVRIRLHL
jgi:DNA-directed RNA polymerase I subunit RPA2